MAPKHRAIDNLTPRPRRTYDKRPGRRNPVWAFAIPLAVLILAVAILAVRWVEYRAARDEYEAYRAMDLDAAVPAPVPVAAAQPEPPPPVRAAGMPTATPLPTEKPFYSSKVAQLKKDNAEAVGWLDVTGTGIQYPVVQAADNDYYITHTFKKKRNASGAIFLDCWNAPGFTDFNTVIYGHNMKDGSMFSGLREYRHQRFFNEHSSIEVTLLTKKLRCRVFAAYLSKGEESGDFRGQGCATGRSARPSSKPPGSGQRISLPAFPSAGMTGC